MNSVQAIRLLSCSIGLLGLFLTASILHAEGLSYGSFIEQLGATHPALRQQALNRELARQDSEIQKAQQSWELGIGAQQAHQEALFASFGPDKVDQSSLNMSLSRPIWKTGAFVALEANASRAENAYGASVMPGLPSPDQSDSQQVSVTFSQPLLKNRGGVQSALAYQLSLDTQQISNLSALEAQENFVLSMSDEYLDWVSLNEQLNIHQKRRDLTRQQMQQIQKRFDKNLVEKVDVLRSQNSMRVSEQNYLLSQAQYKARQLSLARVSQIESIAQQSPDFDVYTIPVLPALSVLLSEVKAQSRQLQMLEYQSQQLQKQYQSVENSQLPELNLDLRTALKEEEQSGLAPGVVDNDDGQDYSVGLNFKKKLGNKSAKNEKQKLKIQIEQTQLEQQYAWMQLAAQIENLYVQLNELKHILALNQQLLKTAEQATEEEQKIYQQGRSDLINVITSHDQVQNVRLQYVQNAVTFHRMYFQLLALSDRLLIVEQE